MTPGSPFSPCKTAGGVREDGKDQAPSHTRGGITTGTWWPGRMGNQECDHLKGRRRPGAITFNPGGPWGPDDPRSPFGPTGPCREKHRAQISPDAPRQIPNPFHCADSPASRRSRTSNQRFHQSTQGAFTGATPVVPSSATDSPRSQRDLVCPAEGSRVACNSKALSKQLGALLAL